jgi:flagellar hook-associated protein 2
VVVNELARAQVTVSATSAPDAGTTVVASGGTITINGVAVAIAGDVTLQQLAAAINGTDGIGVSAAVIRTGAATYRLSLTALQSGEAQAFTITNGLTGGAGITFTDTDQNGVTGDTAADNVVQAIDASLLVNNILVTGPSNTFEELMPGVTITALKKAPASAVRVAVEADTTAVKTQLQAFVTAYNALVAFATEQRSSAAQGNAASIGRDPILRSLQRSLRGALLDAYGTGALTRLAEAGIEFTATGNLALNESVFDAAALDADAVRELFGGEAGAFAGVEALLVEYESVDGTILTGKQRLERQISTMDAQIEAMQRRLALEREMLQRQFSEADLMLSRLKSQATALTDFSSVFGSSS